MKEDSLTSSGVESGSRGFSLTWVSFILLSAVFFLLIWHQMNRFKTLTLKIKRCINELEIKKQKEEEEEERRPWWFGQEGFLALLALPLQQKRGGFQFGN